jgi:Zn finger protein HypA/HybF involved in hydrogenase expression
VLKQVVLVVPNIKNVRQKALKLAFNFITLNVSGKTCFLTLKIMILRTWCTTVGIVVCEEAR